MNKYRLHYRLKWKQSFFALVVVFVTTYLWMLVLTWMQNGFKNFGQNNIVRVFTWIPLFGLLTAKILKIDFNRMMDFLAVPIALWHPITHTTCVFPGCCHGYLCDWGIISLQKTQEMIAEGKLASGEYARTFPTQWLECLVALGVFFAVKAIAKKTKYDCSGKLYPYFLLLFGGTRFFLEFLRDNNKLFWGISDLALHAAAMVLVGAVWLLILRMRTPAPKQKAAKKHEKSSESRSTEYMADLQNDVRKWGNTKIWNKR